MTAVRERAGSNDAGHTVDEPDGPPVVCFPFVGHLVGGSHLSAAKLVQHLDRARYQPLVVLHRPEGEVAELFRAAGIPFEPAPHERFLEGCRLADAAFVLAETLRFTRFLRRRRVRIVHTNDGRTHATWALPTRFAGARLLWHHRKEPEAKGLRFLAPWAADRVISVSRFSAPRPGLFSAARKCTVVHSPFDTDAAEDRASSRRTLIEELQCPPATRVIGFFGSLIARKRPLIFVDTIAEIRARAPEMPLAALIFGHDRDGLAEAVRRRAEARGVADCIRLMGFRYPPEPWLAACDVLLVPAVGEPFGRTLIEAMLLGTVVVAAASGGNLEAVRDGITGFLARPDDPGSLAETTLRVLGDPALRSAVAVAARRDTVGRFGLREHAEAIMRIYDAMLPTATGGGAAGTEYGAPPPEQRQHEAAAIAIERGARP
jgi:glycosyltransferase involved in cell wall biosynthesis